MTYSNTGGLSTETSIAGKWRYFIRKDTACIGLEINTRGDTALKIGRIFAEHFMSFGERLEVSDLGQTTVLVGPNGHGKSNVLRILSTLTEILRNPHHNLSHPQDFACKTVEFGSEIRTYRIGFDFQLDDEMVLLTDFVLDVLAYPGASPLRNLQLADSDGSQVKVDVQWERLTILEDHIASTLKLADQISLSKARLIYEVEPADPHNSRLAIEFRDVGLTLDVKSGLLTDVSTNRRTTNNLINMYVDSLSPEALRLIASFLEGKTDTIPDLPAFQWNLIQKLCQETNSGVELQINHHSTAQRTQIPWTRMSLFSRLGVQIHGSDGRHFGDVFCMILLDSLLVVSDGMVNDRVPLRNVAPNPSMIYNGELPLYLFLMKNGTTFQRKKFTEIQRLFQRYAKTEFDVVLEPGVQESNGQKVPSDGYDIVLQTDSGIRMSLSGSGREQLLMLLTLGLVQHHVICLDEPERNLHPMIQAQMSEMWNNQNSQKIIVTHSPHVSSGFGLDNVRRIYLSKEGFSQCTSRLGADDQRKLQVDRLAHSADDFMFLFARCEVIVEGYGEAFGLPIWLDKWLEKEFGTNSRALGIRIHNAGGKNNIVKFIRLNSYFKTPWVALYDADILSVTHENQTIVDDLESTGLIRPGHVKLGSRDDIKKFPVGPNRNVFLRGEALDQKWEKIDVDPGLKQAATEMLGSGPQMWKYIAENMTPPVEFNPMFRRIAKMAGLTLRVTKK